MKMVPRGLGRMAHDSGVSESSRIIPHSHLARQEKGAYLRHLESGRRYLCILLTAVSVLLISTNAEHLLMSTHCEAEMRSHVCRAYV